MEIEFKTTQVIKLKTMDLIFNRTGTLLHFVGEPRSFSNIRAIPASLGYQHGNSVNITINIDTGEIENWHKVRDQLQNFIQDWGK
jgi:hypothetical protein